MSTGILDDDELLRSTRLTPPLHNSSAPRDGEPSNVEELRKWQEARLERRLRGEYESQVRKLVEVVSGNLGQPSRITAIRVEGAPNTRASFLAGIIEPHIQSGVSRSANATAPPKTSLAEVLETTRRISSLLQETQVFKSVHTTIERSGFPFADDNDVEVVYRCKERGKWFLKTSTDIGNQEGSASATGRIVNAFGGAETVEGNLAFGTKTRRAFQLSLEAPLLALDRSLRTRGEISAFGMQRDNTSFASSVQEVNGIKVAFRTPLRDSSHEFAYEATSRHIGSLTDTASQSIREAAGHSVKSALSHTVVYDTRDDNMTATKGVYSKIFSEIAGLGGDVSHLKNESTLQMSRQLGNGLSASVSSGFGMLYPIDLFASRPAGSQSMFSDRFQLGGPLSIRMFKQNGLGVRDGPDSLGGDMYWSAGLSVISDIPKKPAWPIKFHAFVNAGRLDPLDRSKPIDLVASIRQSLTQPSISAGVGLIYRFDPIRVEVNFGVPLVTNQSDMGRKGFQVGMGLEFL
ncbi:hypothetical protein FRB94_009324 [Tulasnella sp. JGI-2019a]|nr:hypothetical protein FRB94_009324 [Tulasnella sp. JGI-2019a]KAG9028449.1 hypothetical protein FRB95_006481 [Tulasnella sp. JGI-2019a]